MNATVSEPDLLIDRIYTMTFGPPVEGLGVQQTHVSRMEGPPRNLADGKPFVRVSHE